MADFSKQWCEVNDPKMPWDFDIEAIWDDLLVGNYMPFICEGYGFTAIGKLREDPKKVMVFVPKSTMDEGEWVDFETIRYKQLW